MLRRVAGCVERRGVGRPDGVDRPGLVKMFQSPFWSETSCWVALNRMARG